MAEDLTIRGVEVRRRNPWGVWALSLITLNIYGFVWWYKINREMRDVSGGRGEPLGNDPATSVWAIIFAAPITVGTTMILSISWAMVCLGTAPTCCPTSSPALNT